MNNINIANLNQKQYQELKRNYLDAERNNRDKFFIDGQPVLTKFAKYLLDFVENERKSRGERIYEPNKHDMVCKKCGYSWVSRVENVKACPQCKSRRK
jgi:rubrerythrin